MTHTMYRFRGLKSRAQTLCCMVGLGQALVVGCGGSTDPVVKQTASHAGRSSTNSSAAGNTSTATTDGGGTTSTTTTASGGTTTTTTTASAGNGSLVLSGCGLPAAGATGVAQPSGAAGNLTILNWAGFKGAVTYTFDDANSSQIANYAALQALGVRMTFYIQTGKSDASNAIWAQAVLDGHELGNHTKSHAQTGAAADVDAATTFIQDKFGVKAWTMAAPYGDASYTTLAQTRFLINRGVSNALIAPNGTSNPFNLPCFIPAQGALAAAFNSQIDSAQTAGSWRVVLVHGFAGGSDSAYLPVSITEFTASVEHAKSLGNMWIDSMVNVGSYWVGQKTLSSVTPTSSGSDQIWSWTLPANFPPGKCLRVTVPGGTLTQAGNVLPWDDHGYYEIALDAGSVTVSP